MRPREAVFYQYYYYVSSIHSMLRVLIKHLEVEIILHVKPNSFVDYGGCTMSSYYARDTIMFFGFVLSKAAARVSCLIPSATAVGSPSLPLVPPVLRGARPGVS